MTILRPAVLAAAVAAAGCALPLSSTHDRVAQATQSGSEARAAKPIAPRERLPLPRIELTEQLMLKLMLAEVAIQRGQPEVGVPALLEVARETRDPRIAQRATEAAWNARMNEAALEAAGLWLQTDPGNARVRQVLAALLVTQQKLVEARAHFEQWLAADKENVGQSFLQLSALLSRNQDRKAVFGLMRALAQPYSQVPEARLAVAQAAWNAGDAEAALQESAAALTLKPDWEVAALFQAQALQRRSNDEALQFLGEYLKTHPQAKDARLNYARLLVASKRYEEARKQFDALTEQFPQNADVTMAVALLAMQANDYDSAEKHLKRALEGGYGEPDTVRVYLGQLSEERKRYDEALKWYAAVEPGEQYVTAQSRYAGVLAKQGRLADARKHLQQVNAATPQQRVQLTQAEAQILRDANAWQEAYDLLGRALEKNADHPDLLYDHAMAAEKVNRVDVLESNLRKLIKLKPDHAHAYNALGFTLADRNERLTEAHQLIEQALKLAPDDAFIMDSMGWVLFRMGRNREAIDYLERAYTSRPDAEIAAHLGEVLWIVGEQDRARKIWAEALKEHGKNDALQNTIKRFAPVVLPAAR
ncbi:MAG: tetratricopeptide repeat protein [Burkholderiales bacterium]